MTRPAGAGLFLALLAVTAFPVPESLASLAGRKIGIDPGHGAGVNQGVVISEGTWVLDAGLRAQTHLENHRAQVVMTRTTGADPALATRYNLLNSNNVNMTVSIHSNAASAAAVGMEAYYCSLSHGTNSQNLANGLRLRSLSMVHNRNRGTKECLNAGRGFHFGMIRWTNHPSSLPEYYFHTNDWENRNIHNTASGRENVARSLYAGVCDYYGVTPSFEDPIPPSTTFSAGDWVRTTANPSLNLRSGPSISHEILIALPTATLTQVIAHANNGVAAANNHWWYVEVHQTGQRGWLAEYYLEETGGPGNPTAALVIDNSSSGFSASANWSSSSWSAERLGADYRYRSVEQVSDRASWTAELPFAGRYRVYAWWNSASDRSQNAPYTVSHSGGDVQVSVNQRENGGRWNLLGIYDFDAGPAQVFLSCWTSNAGNDIVIADAVRFVTFDEAPPPPVYHALSIEIDGNGSVQRTPAAGEYAEGAVVQLRALPDEGYGFLGWSGDIATVQNPLDLTMGRPYSLMARFGRTYTAWTEQYFSAEERADPAIVGDLAAPAGDGIPNLLKYALGLEPKRAYGRVPTSSALASDSAGTEHLTITFSRPADVSDLEYRVVVTGDVSGEWTADAELVSSVESDGVVTVTYRDPVPANATERRFIRLQVKRR